MLSYFLSLVFNGLMNGLIYAMVALGLTLTYGLLRIVNFAHGEMVMLGAYATYFGITTLGLPFPVAVAVACLLVGALGFCLLKLVFIASLRERENSALIASVGLILVFQSVALLIFGARPQTLMAPVPGVFEGAGVILPLQKVVTILVALAALGGFALFLKRSSLGIALRATGEMPEAAWLSGVDVGAVTSLSFVIGAALAGLTGGLLAALAPVTPFMGLAPVVKGFAVIVLGGLGSVEGALLGALLIGITEALATGYLNPLFSDAYAFAIMIGVLLVRPRGLLGRQLTRA